MKWVASSSMRSRNNKLPLPQAQKQWIQLTIDWSFQNLKPVLFFYVDCLQCFVIVVNNWHKYCALIFSVCWSLFQFSFLALQTHIRRSTGLLCSNWTICQKYTYWIGHSFCHPMWLCVWTMISYFFPRTYPLSRVKCHLPFVSCSIQSLCAKVLKILELNLCFLCLKYKLKRN